MKSQPKKARIAIPDLIKKISMNESNKQNISCDNMFHHKGSIFIDKQDKEKNKQQDREKDRKRCGSHVLKYKMKVSEYMNQSNAQILESREEPDSKIGEMVTGYSTNRTCEESQNRGDQESDVTKQSEINKSYANQIQGMKLSKLSALLNDNKMFINPDKWNQFVNRATRDQQFHKALNAFMYTYFIENYN